MARCETPAKPETLEDKPAPTAAAATATDAGARIQHDAASAELATLLDQKMAKEKRRHQMQWMIIAAILVGGIGGSAAWFVQSPDRIDSLKSAVTEVQAATDVESLTGEYEKSLDKVAVRGSQLDQATEALGMSAELKEGEDAYMEDEMKSMMGGEGQTAGARARGMQSAFGDRAKKAGDTFQPNGEITAGDSFSTAD